MEYRIKMIQRNNGENVFIPQYRNNVWEAELIINILGSPFMLILWLIFEKDNKWSHISEYFDPWNIITYDKTTLKQVNSLFHGQETLSTCDNKAKAEQVIKIHKQDMENKLNKEHEEKHKAEGLKTKKTLYIKVK